MTCGPTWRPDLDDLSGFVTALHDLLCKLRMKIRTRDSLAFEVRIQLWLSKDLLNVQEAHWQIIDALEKGEGNRAGKLLREHIFALAGIR